MFVRARPGLWLTEGQMFSLAEAQEAGWSDKALRSAGVRTASRGLRRVGTPDDLRAVAAAYAVVMQGQPHDWAFSHETAAQLLGLPTRVPWYAGAPVHISVAAEEYAPRRRGVIGHRHLDADDVVMLQGLPVVGAVRTWRDLAARGYDVEWLVATGDAIVRADPHTLPELKSAALRARGRGVVSLRTASMLVRPGADSPMESLARLVLVEGGMPEPELQVELWDGGHLLARFDLFWPQWGIAGEYDGDVHRTDRDTWQRDRGKAQLYPRHGIMSLPITAQDLGSPQRRLALVENFVTATRGRGPAAGADLRLTV